MRPEYLVEWSMSCVHRFITHTHIHTTTTTAAAHTHRILSQTHTHLYMAIDTYIRFAARLTQLIPQKLGNSQVLYFERRFIYWNSESLEITHWKSRSLQTSRFAYLSCNTFTCSMNTSLEGKPIHLYLASDCHFVRLSVAIIITHIEQQHGEKQKNRNTHNFFFSSFSSSKRH